MALLDITYNVVLKDYPLMLATNNTQNLPKELIAGKSETSITHLELSAYSGPTPILINKLI